MGKWLLKVILFTADYGFVKGKKNRFAGQKSLQLYRNKERCFNTGRSKDE